MERRASRSRLKGIRSAVSSWTIVSVNGSGWLAFDLGGAIIRRSASAASMPSSGRNSTRGRISGI